MKDVFHRLLLGNIGMMSYGLFFGWSSPSLPLLLQDESPIPLTLQQATWVSSIFTMGGAIGSLLSVYIVNVIGRKSTFVSTAIPAVIGWMMIAFATSAWELILGRFVCGLSQGIGYTSATMYVGEISPADIRGILTSMLTVATKFGMFVVWTIGPFLSVRDLALVSSLIPVLFFVSLASLPESPYHLMLRGRHQEAIKSLMQLRGSGDVSKEADIIDKSIKIDLTKDTGLWELISVSGNRKALIVVLGLFVIQQWSGSLAIVSYAELIFNETNNHFEGKYVTMVLGGIQMLCSVISACVVDRYDRRTLLLISASGISISTFLIGLFFFLRHIQMDVSEITWLPAAGSIVYIIVYSIGLSALPFTMMSEVFPTNVKALASTIGILCFNFCAFLVTLSYQDIAKHGIHVAFWLFSSTAVLGTPFIYFCVPETKRRTLQEIQQQLHGYKL
ncbi:PREDICTED: facilitated trehalose transporter Tret1-like [Eufriesea mexicana]|uniref:facilitated trehalose transporter Tret1-like n=1 Tax=Eufriesea mexicana TaxID=516756 RepID=UPI00083BC473|nr:PREDICTED: facilitated trehalose transporter Tret1-like [Eufriesea mexicana]